MATKDDCMMKTKTQNGTTTQAWLAFCSKSRLDAYIIRVILVTHLYFVEDFLPEFACSSFTLMSGDNGLDIRAREHKFEVIIAIR